MSNYKRMMVVFNLDNPHHKELFEWCNEQSSNFSGWTRSVLYAHKEQRRGSVPLIQTTEIKHAAAMADLL